VLRDRREREHGEGEVRRDGQTLGRVTTARRGLASLPFLNHRRQAPREGGRRDERSGASHPPGPP
jgi:hypothetical protein